MKTKFIKISGLSGIIFIIISISLIFLFSSAIPEYNRTKDLISKIWSIQSGFSDISLVIIFFLGLVFFIFSLGLYFNISKNKFSPLLFILLIIFSLSLIFLGIFPCHSECIGEGLTMHLFFAILNFISAGFSPILLFFFTRKNKQWKTYNRFNQAVFIFLILLWRK